MINLDLKSQDSLRKYDSSMPGNQGPLFMRHTFKQG